MLEHPIVKSIDRAESYILETIRCSNKRVHKNNIPMLSEHLGFCFIDHDPIGAIYRLCIYWSDKLQFIKSVS